MEAWRCVRRGYSRCAVRRGRYPMLPYHLQSLGRDRITSWDISQRFCWNRHISSCMRWPGNYSWAPYPYFSSQHCSLNWRPPCLFLPNRSQFQYWNWRPDNFTHTSLFHLSSYIMNSEEDKPASKRRKSQGVIKRHWESLNHHNKENMKILGDKRVDQKYKDEKEKFEFSVMSYNILSQDLLEDNSYLYRHCRKSVLIWGFRFPNILREIKHMDADILCLQEVQEDHYRKEIKPNLESLGYHCEYKMRTGRKPDGCAICFKCSKFTLLSANPVEFYRRDIPLLDRDNVGLVLLLQPKFHCTASPICVANTHLLYNPRRGDIKLTQLAMLLAEISSVAHQKDGTVCPIIICGDFNSVPGSPLYSFIKEGKLNYEGLAIGKVSGQEQSPRGQRILSIPIWPPSLGISQNCVYEIPQVTRVEKAEEDDMTQKQLEKTEVLIATEKLSSNLHHHFSLSSVYSHYLPNTGIPEVTTCHSKNAVTVDYIFYSTEKESMNSQQGTEVALVGGLKLLGRLSLLTEEDLWTVNGLPNENNSSDHLPLLAKFTLEH
ncbi:protein angel homolog 2 isoform X2 [Monodelphis domestica]|uniref:protein angel homolog 2 isoform X2 n=1 Tax=Monodelphis domestica TaxID=13616 RepID=UPI0024E1D6F8|nr:protein angel homolog 2 isoform X2 [Monodelphis domestica]